jgi:hypothetical protein
VSPDGLLVIVADFATHRLRVVRTFDGTVATIGKRWGVPWQGIIEMGAMFSNPRSVSFGHDGQSVLVTDTYAVRQVSPCYRYDLVGFTL